MKPFYQQKTFWFAVGSILFIPLSVILNKALHLNFTIEELSRVILPIMVIVSTYIGFEKNKDARVIASRISIEGYKYGVKLMDVFDVISSKDEKCKVLVQELKKVIDESKELKDRLEIK